MISVSEESKIGSAGFYDIHALCRKNKLAIPKTDALMEAVKREGFKVSRTHFSEYGIRSDIRLDKLVGVIKKLKK